MTELMTKAAKKTWELPDYRPTPPKVDHTTNYDLFKTMPGNRPISEHHVRELAESYHKNPHLIELRPVLVNERMEIVDGQHRMPACKLIGIPVPYIVAPGLTITTAQLMNSLQRPWSLASWLHSYAASGNADYLAMERLLDEYGLGVSMLLNYVANVTSGNSVQRFKRGEMAIEDLVAIEDRLDKLSSFGDHVPWRQTRFAKAFLTILKNPEYDHERMIRNYKLAEPTVKLQANVQEWLHELERIYNYGGGKQTRLF